MLLYPDLNLEKTEEQEEQGKRQYDLQRLFAEKFLSAAAQHSTHESTDNNGKHQPHIRHITVYYVADKGSDAAERCPDK